MELENGFGMGSGSNAGPNGAASLTAPPVHSAGGSKMKIVYTVVERGPGKSYWTRVGAAFINHDGSINVRLDAIPVNGTLQLRDYEPRDFERRPDDSPSQTEPPQGQPRGRRRAEAMA